MDAKEISQLSKVQLNQIAVAYLVSHREQAPVGTEKMVDKLISYNSTISSIMRTMEEAKNTVQQLQPKADQVFGSIETLVELLGDVITEEDALLFASKYDLNAAKRGAPQPSVNPPNPSPVAPPIPAVPDMAGGMASVYNKEKPVKIGA